MPKKVLRHEDELHRYLSGFELALDGVGPEESERPAPAISETAGFCMSRNGRSDSPDRADSSGGPDPSLIQIVFQDRFLGLEREKNGKTTNSFPKEWRRK